MMLLAQGDFERGWPEYEWRWKCKGFTRQPYPRPLWDGSPLNGRTILLNAEQGLGDTIQFIRFARIVQETGGRVLMGTPEPLVTLLSCCAGIDQVLPNGSSLPPFQVHATLLSLPALLGIKDESMIPAPVPYLSADPERVAYHRFALGPIRALKVGIAWQGNPEHAMDRHRSFRLSQFEPLASIPGVRLFSLQKNQGAEQLAALDGRFAVTDLARGLTDLMDTASVLKNLDLVITPDTALAHLAGVLGVPVWVAVSFASDWRWLTDRDDSPWYPSMRLFRQRVLDDWDELFDRIGTALRHKLAERNEPPHVPVEIGPGALFDRLAALEADARRAPDDPAHYRELAAILVARDLLPGLGDDDATTLGHLVNELGAIHAHRRDLHDKLAACSRTVDHDPQFVELARSVLDAEDHRADLGAGSIASFSPTPDPALHSEKSLGPHAPGS